MKEFLSKKKKLNDMETIALTKGYSSLLTNKFPLKIKDPGSFTIPCSIGNHYLGASINIMSLSTFKKLGIGHMKPTTVALKLADRSLAQPEGKTKDILVPTRRTLVDVYKGELTMQLNDEHVTFSVFESIQGKDKEACHTIDALDDPIEAEFNAQHTILSQVFVVTSDDEFEDNCDSMVEANNIELTHGW
ncbi:uncharacterized protein LOC108478115 [Gossypium arboreum]|uniref:uncharacterized protein LOC108478115 n=1 Tax=Gossypium arboreum TaxID=29729 RepID=UPI0008196B0A|nr:uncharacterized protein LOC108478115 [Gossypium arboreum]